MRNFLLDYLRYRDSNQIMIFTDCNLIKGSFEKSSVCEFVCTCVFANNSVIQLYKINAIRII